MRWFSRRRKTGKHALGAAVTAIPSVVPQPVRQPVVVAPPAPVVVPAQASAPVEPDIYSSLQLLLETGEAWGDGVPAEPPAVPPAAAPVAPVVPVVSVAPAAPVVVPSVQLGFRDGTYASLDPASPHSRALQALARALVSVD